VANPSPKAAACRAAPALTRPPCAAGEDGGHGRLLGRAGGLQPDERAGEGEQAGAGPPGKVRRAAAAHAAGVPGARPTRALPACASRPPGAHARAPRLQPADGSRVRAFRVACVAIAPCSQRWPHCACLAVALVPRLWR
jgi:hypothetical protein